jgi:hypothetical protein
MRQTLVINSICAKMDYSLTGDEKKGRHVRNQRVWGSVSQAIQRGDWRF